MNSGGQAAAVVLRRLFKKQVSCPTTTQSGYLVTQGYIYVLINPAIPGLAKVGKTTRMPSERASEISSATGVPSPFILLYEQPVDNCDKAEAWVHNQLERLGRRPSKNREFFDAPLHVIVKTVSEAANICTTNAATESKIFSNTLPSEHLSESLYREALRIERGDESNLPNRTMARQLMEEAARHGHKQAQANMIDIYVSTRQLQRALDICRERIDAGEWWLEAKRAMIFDVAGHPHLAEERRASFFQQANELFSRDELNAELTELFVTEGLAYIESVATKKSRSHVPAEHCQGFVSIALERIDSHASELEKQTSGPNPSGNARIELYSLLRRRQELERVINSRPPFDGAEKLNP